MKRILQLFRENHDKTVIKLNGDFHGGHKMVLATFANVQLVAFLDKPLLNEQELLYLDDCLTGMGALWRNRV